MHTSPSGRSYVGQTVDYKRRCWDHQEKAGPAFDNAIKKHGWGNFTHRVLIDGLTIAEANELEEFFIDWLGSMVPGGYNLHTGGGNSKPGAETRAKIGAASKGKSYCKGRVASPETRAKIGAASKARARLPCSTETKEKIRIANTGNIQTAETRAKIAAFQKGKIISADHRKKMSALYKAKPRSQEIRDKISAGHQARKIKNGTPAVI